MIFDTQIISYCYSGHWEPSKAKLSKISAITAAEFLLFHTRENSKVDYYVVNPERYSNIHQNEISSSFQKNLGTWRWAKMGAHRTDSVTIDFSKDFQPYRIFGTHAITSIINEKNINAFKLSISHLAKDKQKLLRKKIEFLLDNDIECYSLTEEACDIALELFYKLQKETTPKNNIKNTINDLLILSTAIDRKTSIFTKDKVLGELAAKEYSGKILTGTMGTIAEFSTEPHQKTRKLESKGYINRGWSYSFRKGNL